jgi:hypothetical protein
MPTSHLFSHFFPVTQASRERSSVLSQHATIALPYFTEAGDAAALRYANAEATAHFRRALVATDLAHVEPAALQHLLLGLGQALELSRRHAEALAAYEQLEAAARDRHATISGPPACSGSRPS